MDSKEMKGTDALMKRFEGLKAQAQSTVFRQAANYAMTPVLQMARKTAPRSRASHKTYKGRTVAPGFLSRSMFRKTELNRKTGTVTSRVGMRKEAFYGTFLFMRNRRNQKKNDFLVQSLSSNKSAVTMRFADKMRDAIVREARKK
jgi:hypothetical protein